MYFKTTFNRKEHSILSESPKGNELVGNSHLDKNVVQKMCADPDPYDRLQPCWKGFKTLYLCRPHTDAWPEFGYGLGDGWWMLTYR